MLHNLPFGFSAPAFLALLLLVPVVWWLERRSLALLSSRRRTISLLIRCLVITLLVFALAGFRIEVRSNDQTVIFALDKSESVNDAEFKRAVKTVNDSLISKRQRDKAGAIVFGDDALVEASPAEALHLDHVESAPVRGYTDISKAIRLAIGLFPEGSQKRLVIFTDGNENLGNAASEANAAAANGIAIDVVPLDTSAGDEVLVESVQTPDKVDKKKPFDVKITVHSTYAGEATLRLYKDKNFVGQQEIALTEGKNIFLFPQQEDDAGFHTYEAMVDTTRDTVRDNNQALSYSVVFGEPRVLLAGADEDTRFLKEALTIENIPTDTSQVPPTSAADAENYDAIFLCNISAETMTNAQLKLLQAYCGDLGGGLAMIGGENSFGLGGYRNTPVEEAMPVSMEIKDKKNFPSLGLIILVDKSGSMSSGLRGSNKSKLELAAEAAVAASSMLTDRDSIGVIGFDSAAKWDCPWQKAVNREEIARNIRSLRPGGGTDAIPAFNEAIRVFGSEKLQLKHIIFITDGMVQPGDYDSIIAQLRGLKVTLTTVGVGDDADKGFLEKLAKADNGRFYFTSDAQSVPRIFTKETVIAQRSYLVEEDFTPRAYHQNEISKGISAMPPLHGYVATEEKDRAEVVLKSHNDDALMAVWHYRMGKSLAWTSDARDRWASNWVQWGDYKKFWGQAARWVMRNRKEGVLHPRVTVENGMGLITVDAVTEKGDFVNFLNLESNVMSPSFESKRLTLRQTAAGHYEGTFEAKETGSYLATVSGEKADMATAGTSVSYPPEYRSMKPNHLLLNQIAAATGGKVSPLPTEFFRVGNQRVETARELWYHLLWVALLLFLYDVGVRRFFLDDEQKQKIYAFIRRIVPRSRKIQAEAVAGTLGALKSRQVSLRTRHKTARMDSALSESLTSGLSAPQAQADTKSILEALEKAQPAPKLPGETQPFGDIQSPPKTPSPSAKEEKQPPDGSDSYTSRLLEARRKARERRGGEPQ